MRSNIEEYDDIVSFIREAPISILISLDQEMKCSLMERDDCLFPETLYDVEKVEILKKWFNTFTLEELQVLDHLIKHLNKKQNG